jgi:hypothetical protein
MFEGDVRSRVGGEWTATQENYWTQENHTSRRTGPMSMASTAYSREDVSSAGIGSCSGVGACSHGRLRLTPLGRFVFFGIPLMLLAAFLLSLSGFFNAPAKAADSAHDLEGVPALSVTVQPGESLWEIAAINAPDRDPRDVIADIVELNHLDSGRVVPGQLLFVPVG